MLLTENDKKRVKIEIIGSLWVCIVTVFEPTCKWEIRGPFKIMRSFLSGDHYMYVCEKQTFHSFWCFPSLEEAILQSFRNANEIWTK